MLVRKSVPTKLAKLNEDATLNAACFVTVFHRTRRLVGFLYREGVVVDLDINIMYVLYIGG